MQTIKNELKALGYTKEEIEIVVAAAAGVKIVPAAYVAVNDLAKQSAELNSMKKAMVSLLGPAITPLESQVFTGVAFQEKAKTAAKPRAPKVREPLPKVYSAPETEEVADKVTEDEEETIDL